ncbi:DUF309 domain-containing protein [Bacillus sp. FJAT-49705]|uniref:DUF309 domain-containing protein n=1 Tax=Cytobacillus citreus TaxID=2833586 RepID=A0ABS5NTD1_9BACI|nr:DUF309 domain-containing protein [Cytobacillus citreus]MBS4191097.1 DUF309 domain-containing protein [Cytobacillus citreus]
MFPKEYIEFLVHFHSDRDYFECHEVLEDYWKSVDPSNKRSIWVGFILFAVSNYHHRRGNYSGAKRTLTKSISIFHANINQLSMLGIDKEKFLKDLRLKHNDISKGSKYISYNLPLIDQSLLSQCINKCQKDGLKWCSASNLENVQIIHRHLLRDRSQVINDRLLALNNKNSNR